MPKTMVTVHMLAFVSLSLAGCSSKPSSEHAASPVVQASSGAPASSDRPDPCKILSKAEVESVIGNVHDIQLEVASDNNLMCKYKTSDPGQSPIPQTFTINISTNHYDGNSWAMAKKKSEEVLGTKPIPVAGLGDDACFLSPNGPLAVLTGQRVVVVGELASMAYKQAGAPNTIHDKEIALARKVVAKVK